SGKHGMLVSDGSNDKVAVGDLSGRIWRGQPLPPGTYGLWAPDGFIAVSMHEVTEVADIAGTSTTSTAFVDIQGFSLTFSLDKEAECLLYMSLRASVTSTSSTTSGRYQMVLDDTPIPETHRHLGIAAGVAELTGNWCMGSVTVLTRRVLSPGQHTLKGQFAAT